MKIRAFAEQFFACWSIANFDREFTMGVIRDVATRIPIDDLLTGWYDLLIVTRCEDEYLRRERLAKEGQGTSKQSDKMYIQKEFRSIKEQKAKILELATEISLKYPSLDLDVEVLCISIKKLMWRGLKYSDLASFKFDGVIIDRYQIDANEDIITKRPR